MQLKFEKLYRYDREQEPCEIAVPVQKGYMREAGQIAVYNSKKEEIVSQTQITSVWEDGSIRWFLTRFQADLKGNQGTEYTLELLPEAKEQTKDNLANQVGEGIQVDTGRLSFFVKNNTYHLFSHISANGKSYSSEDIQGPILKANQKEYTLFVENWEIEENGPIYTSLLGRGKQISEDGDFRSVELRLKAYLEKPWIEFAYRLLNDSDCSLSIDALYFSIKNENLVDEYQNYVASSNYKTTYTKTESKEAIERKIDADYLLYEANEHMAEVFYGTLFGAHQDTEHGICATIFQAQQNYPKAIHVEHNTITMKLVPEGNSIVMQSGMAREQRCLLHFYRANEPIEEINNRSLMYQMPDRPVIETEVYRASGIFQDIFPIHPIWDVENSLMEKADKHARCYGMLNWGDAPDPGYTLQGRGQGKSVWTNNEYDYPHACALQYIRTGIRRYLDFVLVSASHWMDVDICHYSKDPLLYEGQWEHTNGHSIHGIVACSHQWVEGLFDYYHFTGDKRALNTAIGIGNNILRLLDTPMFQQKGEINARETGWALRSLTALYRETNDEYWLKKCDWIVGHFEEWAELYGGWLSPYTDNTVIRVPFMIAVAVGSLMRYYRIRPQEHIKKMIVNAVDDLIQNAYLKTGVFYYKELPSLSRLGNNTLVLEALAIAYELTGEKEYLTYGKKTFENAINKIPPLGGVKRIEGDAVIVSGEGTKNFAQSFLPLVTYYCAGVETGILK